MSVLREEMALGRRLPALPPGTEAAGGRASPVSLYDTQRGSGSPALPPPPVPWCSRPLLAPAPHQAPGVPR